MWEGQQRKQDINGRSSQFCWIYIAFEFWEFSAKKIIIIKTAISISELKYVFSYCQIYIMPIFHNTRTGFGFIKNAVITFHWVYILQFVCVWERISMLNCYGIKLESDWLIDFKCKAYSTKDLWAGAVLTPLDQTKKDSTCPWTRRTERVQGRDRPGCSALN